ncbi:hypothetical protein [Salidesulfovibrio brasiliensis]|uniref:hypothetical protein n=1 Tax=Salidesulfovibrio brasiliensis TaxID=221711 RepID=UPI0006D2AB85|nr:hypothetical protein [Salidesulfovibrio brasiliensis]
MTDILVILSSLQDFFSDPEWRLWPFGPGYGQTLLPNLARLAFVALLMGAILLFLRILFGPKGFLRDHELDREAEEELRREREELDRQLKDGEINEAEYELKMRSLK